MPWAAVAETGTWVSALDAGRPLQGSDLGSSAMTGAAQAAKA
ncbi:hypothetical protein PTW37_15655 [Arthrobacter agilis]|nr:hypothetical protein [Arthrobacter agilis]WDF33263.1 hypothetical protein PTW37_15655 [Arthrobacter agilis]